jgi:hypothetical protein
MSIPAYTLDKAMFLLGIIAGCIVGIGVAAAVVYVWWSLR